MTSFKDIQGMKFGRLTAIEREARVPHGHAVQWKCICDCGNVVIVNGSRLRRGITQSCGCLQKELARERTGKLMKKHGDSRTRLFRIWSCMKNRCTSKNNTHFNCYGGRGIRVCDEWLDFESFRDWALNNGYEDTLTIDRIDVNGNYEPSNCRWATRKEQAQNRRTTRFIEYKGETHSLKQWSEILGMPDSCLKYRLDKGWSIEKAFTKPKQRGVMTHGKKG